MKKLIKIILFTGVFFAFLVFIVFIPQTYKKGVNYKVGVYKIPLYAKIAGFIYRDYEYRTLSRNIAKDLDTDEDKVFAIYSWTIENIKDTPKDWPIVDDHILNIIIRGYGSSDQMADVFTTLCAYSGMRAFWRVFYTYDSSGKERIASLILSFVKVGDRWVVFDVYHRKSFLNDEGKMASLEELIKNPELVERNVGDFRVKGIEYVEFFKGAERIIDEEYLRPEKQMIGKRLLFEMNKVFKR